jgi:probable HAF family extracellular repeat protein
MRHNLVRIAVVVFVLTTFGGLASTPGGAASAVTYRVEDLGTLPGDYASAAMGINGVGAVVGWSVGPNGTRAFVYTDATGMTALPTLAGRPVSSARAISAAGTIVGTASTGGTDIGHAVRWQSGTARDLGTLGAGTFSEARDVNATGVTVGTSYTNGGGLLGIHAFRHSDASGLIDLTPTVDSAHAEGINDVGQVTGWRNSHAFRLDGVIFRDLGVPAPYAASFGTAINASGQVAGHVISGSGNVEKIFRYSDSSGLVILGGNGQYNRALGINNAGSVVGWGQPDLKARQGFIYTDAGGMQGLNGLIDPAAGWFILGAGDINAFGQIAGWASGPRGQRAVRLTPTGGSPSSGLPSAPSALTASLMSPPSVRLGWTDNAGNETGYRIERSVGIKGTFVLLAQVGANATTYSDSTITTGTTYRYRVRAFNASGSSAWSNVASVG